MSYMLENGQFLEGLHPDGVDEALGVFCAYRVPDAIRDYRTLELRDAFARGLVAYRAWEERQAAEDRASVHRRAIATGSRT